MPTETDRKMIRLRVVNPDQPPAEGEQPAEGTYVDIPVINEITFKDAKSYAQEYVHTIDNTDKSTRIGHSHTIKNATKDADGNVTFDDSNRLEVERCDFISFVDAKSYAQESRYALHNNDPAPQTATPQDGDPQHLKTHIVRYTADNTKDGTPWIDVELIDEIELKDPKSYAQGSIYGLTNPDPGERIADDTDPYNIDVNGNPLTLGFVDQSLDLVIHAPTVTAINPPWRFDFAQNPVNVNWGGIFVVAEGGGIIQIPPNPTPNIYWSRDGFKWTLANQSGFDGSVGFSVIESGTWGKGIFLLSGGNVNAPLPDFTKPQGEAVVIKSTDGKTWNRVYGPRNNPEDVNRLGYNNDLKTFFALSNGGFAYGNSPGSDPPVVFGGDYIWMTSETGTKWNDFDSGPAWQDAITPNPPPPAPPAGNPPAHPLVPPVEVTIIGTQVFTKRGNDAPVPTLTLQFNGGFVLFGTIGGNPL